MRNRKGRQEPVFEDEQHLAYEGPHDHAAERSEHRVTRRRLFAAPGGLVLGFVMAAATVAFVTNALYLQKTVRPAALIDLSSIWRSAGTLNPYSLMFRSKGETAPGFDTTPQPPRRPDKVEAVQVPVPMPALASPKLSIPVGVVASADPNQVFAPPQPVPTAIVADPVGALVAQTMPMPDKCILGVQRALNKIGYGPVSPDGLKSSVLRDAVLHFQKDRHLPQTGEADPTTRPLLAKASGLSLD